jgi:hypothetical protein
VRNSLIAYVKTIQPELNDEEADDLKLLMMHVQDLFRDGWGLTNDKMKKVIGYHSKREKLENETREEIIE